MLEPKTPHSSSEPSQKNPSSLSRGGFGGGLLGVALSAALFVLSFPPHDLHLAAWVALAPWLRFVCRGSWRQALAASIALGLAVNVALLSWLRFVTVAGWLMLALYLSAYWPAAGMAARWMRRKWRVSLVLLFPPLWSGFEYLRGILFTGFPWFMLGHTQHQNLLLIQVADLTGVHGISFVLAMANGLVTEALWERRESYLSRRWLWLSAAICAASIAILVGYGAVRLRAYEGRPGPTLCLVQGNVPQDLKHSPKPEDAFEMLEKHRLLSLRAKGQGVDLLVWPETMMPGVLGRGLHQRGEEFSQAATAALTEIAKEVGCHLLIGSLGVDLQKEQFLNSAYYLSPEMKLLGRYDKIHLVLFGEYTPLADYFPFLRKLRPPVMGPDLAAGLYRPPFELERPAQQPRKFVVTICYEDTEPRVTRRLVMMGADFMVNLTNDGWFPSDAELAQHNAICVFRAVEHRIPIARCANTGISCFIAPTGKVISRLEEKGRYRNVTGVLIGRLEFGNLAGFYTRFGDWFAWLCAGVSLGLLSATFLRNPPSHRAVEHPISR